VTEQVSGTPAAGRGPGTVARGLDRADGARAAAVSGGAEEPPVGPGTLLGGRYRLLREARPGWVGSGAAPSTLWRADDEVLARPAAVRVLDLRGPAADRAGAFLAAAVRAGRATGGGLISVLDAAEEGPAAAGAVPADGPRGPVAYVVAEWVQGRALDALLREGPLTPAQAAGVGRAVALALVRAHDAGVHAGRLHPGQVLVGAGGAVRLGDAEVAGALRGLRTQRDPVRVDTEGVARLLHATLTCRWPVDEGPAADWRGLPPTPLRDGKVLHPRQLRAGIPRAVDAVVVRALGLAPSSSEPPLRTPAALAAALAGLAATAAPAGPPGVLPEPPDRQVATADPDDEGPSVASLRRRRITRRVRLASAAVFLALVGTAGWVSGQVVGNVPAPPQAAPRVPGKVSAGAPADEPIPLGDDTVFTFDPPPGDGTENEGQVPDAYDADPASSWTTERYVTAGLGNIKSGVGLLVDLRRPLAVSRVVLTVPPGEGLQLYAAAPGVAARPTALAGLTPAGPAAQGAATGDTTLTPPAGTTARWWLVWITKLPTAAEPGPGGAFQGSVTELAFYPAR